MASSLPLGRRDFLRRSLRAGALVTGAVAVPSLFEASDAAGAVSPSHWRQLSASLRGHLVLPSTPGYATRALLYNSKFAPLRPAAIAYCAGSNDVAHCLDFVTKHQLDFATRSGGHSYGGYSTSRGLVIDVSRLATISLNPQNRTATIGAGARLIDVYNELGRHGLILPGGSCPSVGIAGLTLGGGVGVFTRKFGLTSDHLRSTRLVTAASQQISANQEQHTDLYWAMRGGGGGNFGVNTSFEFELDRMPSVTLFSLQYPWARAAEVLEGWQHWLNACPDELWSSCHLFSQGTDGLLIEVSGVFCGTADQLEPHLRGLRRGVGAPTSNFVGADDYLEAMMIEAGCSRLSIVACHMAGEIPGGMLGHEAYAAKSSYVDAPDSSARAAQWVRAVETLQSDAPFVGGGLAFDAYGGTANRIATTDTAFVHRDKLAGVQATYSWGAYTSPAEIAAGARWLHWLGLTVFDPRAGAYQNYIDPSLRHWKNAYYGTNLARLIKVKSTYDPENLFSFAQSIPTH